jgi:hypothetical protein
VNTGGTLKVKGLMGSETLTGVTVLGSNVTTANNRVTAASGSGGFVASNYAIYSSRNTSTSGSNITNANNTADISPASLTITPNNVNKTYGTSLPSTTTQFVATGLLNNETIGSVSQASDGLASAANGGQSYGIVLSNATGGTFLASNYTITYTPYVSGVSGGAVIIDAPPPKVQYVPPPMVVQPAMPVISAPSGLNYIPVSAAPTGTGGSSAAMAAPAAQGGNPTASSGNAVARVNSSGAGGVSGGAGTSNSVEETGVASNTGVASGNSGARTTSSSEGDANATNGQSGSGTSTRQFTAIGKVGDLVAPTDLFVVNGGINRNK